MSVVQQGHAVTMRTLAAHAPRQSRTQKHGCMSLDPKHHVHLKWTDIARGMGMQAIKVETVAALDQAFADAMAQRGPCLIEVML